MPYYLFQVYVILCGPQIICQMKGSYKSTVKLPCHVKRFDIASKQPEITKKALTSNNTLRKGGPGEKLSISTLNL